jgi:hypothetical protein
VISFGNWLFPRNISQVFSAGPPAAMTTPEPQDQVVDIPMPLMPSSNIGSDWDHHARQKAFVDRVVLDRLSDRHPLKWHLGISALEATWPRLLQKRVAAVRQAPPRHG